MLRFLFILTIIPLTGVYAQVDTITIKFDWRGQTGNRYDKEYQVTLPDSLKNGTYKIINKYGLPIIEGVYRDDRRVGVWSYRIDRANAPIYLKFDFDTMDTVFFDPQDYGATWSIFFGGYDYLSSIIESVLINNGVEWSEVGRMYIKFSNQKVSGVEAGFYNSEVSTKIFNAIQDPRLWNLKGLPDETSLPVNIFIK